MIIIGILGLIGISVQICLLFGIFCLLAVMKNEKKDL
jgi:hypothetical protein